MLLENLNVVTAEIVKFQQEFNESLKKKENELLELQSIVSEKEQVIKSQVNQLIEAELSSIQQESNVDNAWNRIRRCERKVKYLIRQLDLYEQNRSSSFWKHSPDSYRNCSNFNQYR